MQPETAVQQLNFDGTPFYPEAGTPLEPAKLNFIQHIGDMATKTVIIAQIKAEDVLEVVSNTATAMKDYLKQEGGKIVAHTYLATVAVTGGGLASFLETHTAEAATGPQYTVSSAANGGIYSRNTPHWNDTPHIDGQGIYPGDVLTLECGIIDGDPVGQYNNTTWYYAHDESRNEPDLWVSDHFMDTPNAPSQLAPGVTTCVNEGTNPVDGDGQNQNTDPTVATTVFFSPIYDQTNGLPLLPNVADVNYKREDWSSGDCSDVKMQQLLQSMPSTVNTLAGWSRGRMGPAYFLETASQSQRDQIHTIILFDPGDTNSFTNGGCETDPVHPHDLNTLYANWLSSNSQNRLIIYTGIDSEEGEAGPYPQPFVEQLQDGTLQQQPYIDNETFAGLWKYYLAGIWNQPFANQAQICDYNGMSHESILRNFAYIVKNPQNGCPVAADGQQPVSWNP